MYKPQPLVAQKVPCKCCGSVSRLFGVADFNKNCEQLKKNPLPMSGIPIFYHRCTRCGFIFTIAFDEFSDQDFLNTIYNADYALVDPEYAQSRPVQNANVLAGLLQDFKSISILDYGGGNGMLAAALRSRGFADVDTYDPFVPQFATRPARRYDCVVSFEVVEHSNRPHETFRQMESLMKQDGLMFFSTLLQPDTIDKTGVAWWYIAPRNGHVSIYTPAALASVLNQFGLHTGCFNELLHVACRSVPPFARHFAPNARAVRVGG